MSIELSTAEFKAVYILILLVAVYYIYYFPSFSKKTSGWFINKYPEKQAETYLFLFQKLFGFFMLGPVSAVIYFIFFEPFQKKSYLPDAFSFSVVLVLMILIPLLVIFIYFSSKNKEIYNRIPHMRHKDWTPERVLISIAGWGLYLFGYEFIFRELLLFSWAEAYGVVPSIAVNTAIYSAFHLPNGKNETLASIFFGIILCLVSLQAGSFLPAFLLHFTLSASTEMFSIYHNPEMSFKYKRVSA